MGNSILVDSICMGKPNRIERVNYICRLIYVHPSVKAAYSVTMNIFRIFFFSFLIICKSRIKLCFHNKNVQYS